ncbi:ParB/RepB/Spo0J family partition protein [Sutterella massiliensis]|uniref:ParB/RepB/Spo0J family partition protein n=1 Tax=Sutterella massiliensis TaxID=1816689 RepID=A0ABS2DPV1_9BURK|nr:ParB/RepB/Spo0J family partition protein [Sutterella massiliensis]MBM6703376.1 ParB/RepB/Spo0J family partition protein [Sutterella massiliensis]
MALDVSRLKAMTEGYSSLGHHPGNSVLEIALDKIERDESQPRKNFDEDTLRDLAESIEAYGLLQPIVVRKKPNALDRYIIVAGERRYRASQLLRVHTIKAVLLETDHDDAELGYLQVIENIKRDALTTAEIADFIAGRIGARETAVSIGKKLGISKPQMTRYAAWGDMPESIRELVRSQKVPSIKIAYELYRKWKETPEAVDVAISEAADDFEWTMAAVKRIGNAPEVEDFDTGAAEPIEAVQNQEEGETPEEPRVVETEETAAQWDVGADEDEESASFEPPTDSEEEDGVAEVSFDEATVETVDARSANKRLPCVVVVVDGREAALILKHAPDGFVTVQFLDEDDAETVEVEVERVRLLRVEDGQDE